MGRKADHKKKMYTIRTNVKSLSIKCYDEQLPDGWETVKKMIKALPKEYHVIAIRHDRDYNADDIWEPSVEKPHYHIIWRTTKKVSEHVSTVLNKLGVKYRPGIDDNLWKEHGVEGISDFGNLATYLTHDTKQAILDGKTHYEFTELVSNLSIEEIKNVRDGYVRVSAPTGKIGMQEMKELDEQARKIGYELKDFVDWYSSLDFSVRAHSKMNVIEKSYYLGVRQRIEENNEVNRLCIYIQGDKNVGKTYAAIHAFDGMKVLTVGGGGTGKFDTLSPATNAIIIDDDKAPNLLNMTDNYMCQVFRRNRNNPYWCGEFYVVTSNLPFRQWLEECGITTSKYDRTCAKDTEHYRAMLSRFYVCHIENKGGVNVLVCDSVSKRGTSEEQKARKGKFINFRNIFNKLLSTYVPETIKVDYTDVND